MRYNALKSCATRVCRACIDETTCVAERYPDCEYVSTWEHTVLPYGRKNPLPFPLFRSGHMSAICARLSQKEVGVKRVETLVSTLLPRRRARHVPAVRRRRISSLNLSEKPPARKETNTLTQFEYPAQPVLKKTAVRTERSAARLVCPGTPAVSKDKKNHSLS